MKHLFISMGIACLLAVPVSTSAQEVSTKDLMKQRKEIYKASKAELNEKATKAAKKEAKKLQKEGWVQAPGALPLEKQLDKSYLMQMEYDESMYPKYLMGEAMSIGENYDAGCRIGKAKPCCTNPNRSFCTRRQFRGNSATGYGRSRYRNQKHHG